MPATYYFTSHVIEVPKKVGFQVTRQTQATAERPQHSDETLGTSFYRLHNIYFRLYLWLILKTGWSNDVR